MKRSTFFISLILLCNSIFISAYPSLRVLDPQSWWSNDQGTIEEATLAIRPHGLYMEYGLYLTFSARNTGFSSNDVLEVELLFDLPEGTIVNDLWLWIGDDIMKAQIMDQWTASSIYEEIVNRREDPALLIKRGKQNYELRVYPMDGDGQRKVKINYLVPNQWGSNLVSTNLPMDIIHSSKNGLKKMNVIYFPEDEWINPTINELPEIKFQKGNDQTKPEHYIAEISESELSNSLSFGVKSPIENGIYVNKYGSENEGIYQLAYLPSEHIEEKSAKKLTFLIDYEANKSNISLQTLFLNLKSLLKDQFTNIDSFNILYSKLDVIQASDTWLPADSSVIENTLLSILADSISFYSNLPSLLKNGIEFIQNNGNDGSILLIANTDKVGDFELANQLLDDLQSLMNPIIPIHISDFNNINYQYNWFGGRNYKGNEYFYLNLSRITHSNYKTLDGSNTIGNMLTSIVQSLSGLITSFDLHTSLENGFCYGRFNTNLNETIYLNQPILQIGKYIGSFPMQIEVSGVYDSKVFTRTLSIDEDKIFNADSVNNSIWSGNYISSLETGYESNEEVNNIINLSLENRILSLYTAFIALEPNDSSEFCYDCNDDSEVLISVDENEDTEIADSLFIQAYPNPFNPTTTLNVNLPKNIDQSEINMSIYNILGEEVIKFDPMQYATSRRFTLTWNGKNNYGESVSTGIYFFVLSTKEMRQSIKLMMMK